MSPLYLLLLLICEAELFGCSEGILGYEVNSTVDLSGGYMLIQLILAFK